jgi:hypothetical protein
MSNDEAAAEKPGPFLRPVVGILTILGLLGFLGYSVLYGQVAWDHVWYAIITLVLVLIWLK